MKKSDFYTIHEENISFVQTQHEYPIHDIGKTEVLIRPVEKSGGNIILNSIANAATSSIANGDEKVNVILRVHFKDVHEDILMNTETLNRTSFAYTEIVEATRRLQKSIKQLKE